MGALALRASTWTRKAAPFLEYKVARQATAGIHGKLFTKLLHRPGGVGQMIINHFFRNFELF